MANEHRTPPHDLSWIERLALDPAAYDFYVALRRFDSISDSAPRIGAADRPSDEPIRLGQKPSLSFEPRLVTAYEAAEADSPARLMVGFLGLWGPSGPMPTHLTEYARERMRNFGDAALARFADIFHHRMLSLFYRAWAQTQPTVQSDRPQSDAFTRYVGAFCGLGLDTSRGRTTVSDAVILHYAGRMAAGPRNADGLTAILADHFGLPVRIQEFVGEWMTLPHESTWCLGVSRDTGRLGQTTVVGRRVWSRAHRFRIFIGPLDTTAAAQMLPGSPGMADLATLVRHYTNDEWAWDVVLRLKASSMPETRLNGGARLGWSTRLGSAALDELSLIFDPARMNTRRAQSHFEDDRS
jgi:type VI secretion system protein ImpH